MSGWIDAGVLVQHATADELKLLGDIARRANAQPAVLVTVREGGGSRGYVVAQEDEGIFRDIPDGAFSSDSPGVRYILAAFGAQWLRSYGRVDEMYRTVSLAEVVKVERVNRERVWN